MWISAITKKPYIDSNDKWNEEHKISERVVVWLSDSDRPNFATYNHFIQHWSVEGYTGFDQDRIKYFMYISNPNIKK